jgi:hypothetical protein
MFFFGKKKKEEGGYLVDMVSVGMVALPEESLRRFPEL